MMVPERPPKIDQNELERIVSFLRYAQKYAFYFWQHNQQNTTIDISTTNHIGDADRPDPLRLPEILIIIGVLLLWCGSIVIFIRHSELLRIRQRDVPYRSSLNTSMDLNPITVGNRTSDLTIQGKSRPSSASGLTPPTIKQSSPIYKRGEVIEGISLVLPPILQKRRHTHAFDCRSLSRSKLSLEKTHDKQQFLHPERISLNICPEKIETNSKPKSEDNLSTSKHPTCYSANNILKAKLNENITSSLNKKRCIQESPV